MNAPAPPRACSGRRRGPRIRGAALDRRGQRRVRRADDDLDPVELGDAAQERGEERLGLGDRLVHLPVRRDQRRARMPRAVSASCSASTPGSSLALHQLERGAAAGREPVDLVGEPERRQRRGRVAAADHGDARAPRPPPRRPPASRRRTAPARTRPSARSRTRCPAPAIAPAYVGRRPRADVEAHPAVGHLDPVELADLGRRRRTRARARGRPAAAARSRSPRRARAPARPARRPPPRPASRRSRGPARGRS